MSSITIHLKPRFETLTALGLDSLGRLTNPPAIFAGLNVKKSGINVIDTGFSFFSAFADPYLISIA